MIEAHFENIRNLIIDNIKASKSEIKIAVAWFTQRQLFDAVLDALKRDVKVSLIVMKDFINCGMYGLPLQQFVDKRGKLHFVSDRSWTMHNKFCLFDSSLVITGSYNWTYSAETRNAENVILTNDSSVCQDYNDYFTRLWDGSQEELQVPLIEIKSEDVIKDFSTIHDEIDAMVKNNMVLQDAIDILKKTKNNADAEVAKIAMPIMPSLNPVIPVYFDGRRLTQGECVMLKKITLRCADGDVELVNRGAKLPIGKGGIITYNEEGSKTEEFVIRKWSSFTPVPVSLLCFENLKQLPAGKIYFKASMNISKDGLLSFCAFCSCSGETKRAEIQLDEDEDFIIGK